MIDPLPPRHPQARLAGRRVPAGQLSRDYVAALLGIDAAERHAQVSAVAWTNGALEALVRFASGQETVFRIERRSEDSQGLVRAGELVLYYRGGEPPKDALVAVVKTASRTLKRLTLHSVAQHILADPEVGKPGLATPPSADAMARPASLLDSWGDDGAYGDFFAGSDIARSQLDSIDFLSNLVLLQHGDEECANVYPHSEADMVSLVSFPWDDRQRRHGARFRGPARQSSDPSVDFMTTRVDEYDVIAGNPRKAANAIEAACRLAREREKSVLFANTCLPSVTGEDVRSQVRSIAGTSRCQVFFLTVSPESMTEVFSALLVDRRHQAERGSAGDVPRAINLVGFPRRRDVDELSQLLSRHRISVNTQLLPDLSEAIIDSLPTASLNVMYPNQTWRHLYEQINLEPARRAIMPPAPFGVAGTVRWLAAVEDALEPRESAMGTAVLGDRTADSEDLLAEARQYTLAIAVRSQEIFFLTRPEATWGVPLLAVLEEFGFSLEILVGVADKREGLEAARRISESLLHPERHVIRGFSSLSSLLDRLRKSPAQAGFSNHFFDWRLTSSGKNLFSLQHFEMGLEGAARTLERLVRVCRTPFFRLYSEALRRPDEEPVRPDPRSHRSREPCYGQS